MASSVKALLVVDAQVGLLEGSFAVHSPEAVIANIASLLSGARSASAPVVFVQHDGDPGGPLEPGSAGAAIHPRLTPLSSEPVVHKRASDSFYQTDLESLLRALGVDELVVAGCMSAMCIDTTCRRATSIGFDVQLAGDAHTGCGDGMLTAAQVVAHHNAILDDFGNDSHVVRVVPSAAINWP